MRNKSGLALLFAVMVVLASISMDAGAVRLGGGKSFGMNRGSGMMQREAMPVRPIAPAPTPAVAQPNRSGMWGMLGGLALGAGLGALLGGGGLGGMGSSLMTMLLVAGGVMLLFRLFSRASPQPVIAEGPARFEPVPPTTESLSQHAPVEFDGTGFLRQAKLNFVRLQAANDAGNMEDIKLFSTPEFFAEVQLQYQERGRGTQQTDVVQLDAAMLDLVTEGQRHIASVRFFGQLREMADAAPQTFEEVWHLIKPVDDSSGWVVAGIQQFA